MRIFSKLANHIFAMQSLNRQIEQLTARLSQLETEASLLKAENTDLRRWMGLGPYRYDDVLPSQSAKYKAEIEFWKNEILLYIRWYMGEINDLYAEPSPSESQKIKMDILKDSAIFTWSKVHQETKYMQDLSLPKGAFANLKILDIGAGPIPSAHVFEHCDLYCLDPLIPAYMSAGFPFNYPENVKLICGFAENIPVQRHFFDAIISVNALDHVDNFTQAVSEIKRVLKPNGKIRLHLHYHKPSVAEPVELNDDLVMSAFSWCNGFSKIGMSKHKRGYSLEKDNEVYALWSNF